MATIALKTPYLTDGLRSVNFFNGRVLSGEDMAEEQEARRQALLRLGCATGTGVAYGLDVSGVVGQSTLTVQPGLAINRLGEALELPSAVDVSLVGASAPVSTASASTDTTDAFGACGPATTTYVAGEGVFLLVICPARGREGRAVVGGIATGGLAHSCAAASIVEGVQFRLLRLDVTDFSDTDHLRNAVAHLCFGTADPALTSAISDPFGQRSDRYGLIDALRGDPLRDATLSDCDVPLAVVYYKDGQAIRFVDQWSARRRIVRPAWAGPWAPLVDDRRTAEAEATFMQFQAELASIDITSLTSLVAGDRFRYLPPVGLLPVAGVGASRGVDLTQFFTGMALHPWLAIEGARVRHVISLGFSFPPIDLTSGELVWTYVIRENRDSLSVANPIQPYILFASGHIPYLGEARINVGRVSYSNLLLP
jgi:hypothetical protein